MKLSLNWLKDYVDPKLTTEQLVHRLTMAGLEVEGIHAVGGDTVLELEITPNRPDCLNVLGLAREIAAMTGKALKQPRIKEHKPTRNKISITIADAKDCSRYIATLIANVSIVPAPEKMAKYFGSIGLRCINNAVDITNFVLMELGQPLHAFDYDKLAGGKIIVRRAKAGETIVTLDGIERKLDPSILIIADEKKPVAIAGVMGGKAAELTSATKNVLLESASFDLGLVRRTSRALALKSDSSYRFERGVDFEGVRLGADRATDLICSLTGGTIAARTDFIKNSPAARRLIPVAAGDIEGLLGTAIAPVKVKGFLSGLGFNVQPAGKNAFNITPPTWRNDVKAGVDIVEEIARMVGYDRLSEGLPVVKAVNIQVNPRPRAVKETAAQTLMAQGFSETVTYSLVSKEMLERTGLKDAPVVALKNFLSRDHSLMRPSMLPSMLNTVKTNLNHGQRDLRLFEIGKIYSSADERTILALVMMGRRDYDWQSNSREAVGFYDLKGAFEGFVSALGLSFEWKAADCSLMETAADFYVNGKKVGRVGKVSSGILANWDIKAQGIYFGRIDLELIFAFPAPEKKYQSIPSFPAIGRDISIAVKTDVPYADIERICRSSGGNLLKSVSLIEEYTGDKVPSGTRALVFSLTYQSNDRTLREDEVNAVHQGVLNSLSDQTGAVLR